MFWLLIAFVTPVLHGLANIIDEYFVNKIFKNIRVLIFLNVLLDFILGLIIFLIKTPSLPSLSTLPFLVIISLIEILYVVPYFLALKSNDTSVVISLFSLGNILVPVLAFFIVGELLNFHQYVGFFIIVLSGFLLSFEPKKKLKVNVSFLYMFLCSVMLSVETVLYKYVCNLADWSANFVWMIFISFLFVNIFLLFSKKYRNEVRQELPRFKPKAGLLLFGGLLSFIGQLSAIYVISLIPVTLEQGINASQPIFVLLYAIILSKKFPNTFKENIDKKSILKKIVLFVFIIIGIIITLK